LTTEYCCRHPRRHSFGPQLDCARRHQGNAGRLGKFIIINGGTDGMFMLNDCARIDAAGAANVIFAFPFGATAGSVYDLIGSAPVGIVLSAVPGGTPMLAVSFS
jgi:hypothetical protein